MTRSTLRFSKLCVHHGDTLMIQEQR